jgi:TP901 family phage tail tape measure protein
VAQTVSQKLIARFGANLDDLKKGFRTAVNEAEKAGQRMRAGFGRATAAARTLLKGVGLISLAVTGIGALAVREFVKWEEALTGVAKTVDATDAEIRALGQSFVRLSEVIPVSANELARLGEVAGQLGVELPNIEQFVKVAAALGVSTNLAAEEAATGLARFSNVMGTATEDVDRLGSVIVDLGNNLATTEAEILDMSLRITGAGNQIGLTEAQVLSFSAALSSLGIRSEAGGSAISRVFANMASAVSEGGDMLKNFATIAGDTVDDFRLRFELDAAGAVIKFIEGLDRLSRSGANVFKALESVDAIDIRVRDTLLRAAGGVDVLRDALSMGNTAWKENTALTEEAARFYDRLGARLVTLRNKLSNVAAEMGERLAPIVEVGINLFSGFLDQIRQADPALAAFATNAAAKIPQMVETVVNSIGQIGLKLVSVVRFFEDNPLAGGMGLIGLVFFGPQGAAVAGAIGLAIDTLINKLGGPQSVVEALNEKLRQQKSLFDEALSTGNLEEAARLSTIMEGISRTIQGLAEEDFREIGESGTGAFDTLTNSAEAFFTKMTEFRAQLGGAGQDGESGMGAEAERTADAFAEMEFRLAPLPERLGRMKGPFDGLNNNAEKFRGTIESVAGSISSGIGNALGNLVTGMSSIGDAAKQLGRTILRTIVAALVRATIQAAILRGVLSVFGLGAMPVPTPLGFATGGIVPGTGPTPAIVHGGEVVLSREAVAALGGPMQANAMNTGQAPAPASAAPASINLVLPEASQIPRPIDFGIIASEPNMIRWFVEMMRQARMVGAV